MIVRRHRFHGYGSLKAVYSKGLSVRGESLSLKYIERAQNKQYRVSIVVSRKVSKSAVIRNRVRRRLYEIVRTHEAMVPGTSDLVFTVFSDQLAKLETSKLEASVLDLLEKVRPN
jgi:ribonuclease P protein component